MHGLLARSDHSDSGPGRAVEGQAMGKGNTGIWIAIAVVMLIALFLVNSRQEPTEEGIVIELQNDENGELEVKEVRLDGEEMEQE